MKQPYHFDETGLDTSVARDSVKRNGRRQEIEDGRLRHLLFDFHLVLDRCWGHLGWELITATTLADIRRAFLPTAEFSCPGLDRYRKEPAEPSTMPRLRKIRKDLDATRNESWNAYERLKAARQLSKNAFAAITGAKSPESQESMLRRLPELRRNIGLREAEFRMRKGAAITLAGHLDKQEAYVAQSELLDFIQSSKRRLSPLSIAMAMAGLPFIPARISFSRCRRFEEKPEPTLGHQIFCMIDRACSASSLEMNEILDHARRSLPRDPKKPSPSMTTVYSNWHLLELSIKSTFERGPHLKSQLPFLIFAEYERLCLRQRTVELASRMALHS